MTLPTLDRNDLPGIIGIGLLLFCLSFYLSSIEPARQELAELKARLQEVGPPRTDGVAETAHPSAARTPPALDTAADALKALNTLAEQHGVQMDRATYALSNKEGVERLEINLPLKASYPALRAYLHAVLAQPGAPNIDELLLQRQNATDTQLEATVRLSSYFSATRSGASHLLAQAPDSPTDIFAPRNWEPPPPPPVVEGGPQAPPKPEAPPLPFRFIGRLDEQGKPPLFFLVNGEQILPVRSGQLINGKYRVGKTEGNQLHFTYLPLQIRQSLTVGSNS